MQPVAGKAGGFRPIEAVRFEGPSRLPGKAEVPVAYIEFKADGSLADPPQFDAAKRVLDGIPQDKPLVLVGYVHGWNNGSLSGDVLKFKEVVGHLGRIGAQGQSFRVMGLYLAGPGAAYRPLKEMKSPEAGKVSWARPYSPLLWLPDQLTVWNRWGVALDVASEGKLAGVIGDFTAAAHAHGPRDRAVLLGHSMGALVLEKAVVAPWARNRGRADARMPDLVFTMNSAAPAVLAKQAVEYLGPGGGTDQPRVVSITSGADKATRGIAQAAFSFGRYAGWMKRAADGRKEDAAYMHRTPGHSEPLISHHVERVRCEDWRRPEKGAWLLRVNLQGPCEPNRLGPKEIAVYPKDEISGCPAEIWRFTSKGTRPKLSSPKYWIVQVPKALIRDHGDIWDPQAVSVMAAAFREAGLVRQSALTGAFRCHPPARAGSCRCGFHIALDGISVNGVPGAKLKPRGIR